MIIPVLVDAQPIHTEETRTVMHGHGRSEPCKELAMDYTLLEWVTRRCLTGEEPQPPCAFCAAKVIDIHVVSPRQLLLDHLHHASSRKV